jgi:hypothetical protein
MDGHRFDDLSRAVASGLDRRRLVKGFAGATFGGALTRHELPGSDASCPSEQVHSRRGCVCKTSGLPPNPATGYCPCRNGLTRCGDACVSGTCQPCTPIGFEPENARTESTVCCDGGGCVAFPTFIGEPSFCRPADCRLGGEPCTIGSHDSITACRSWTCSGDTCQQ